MKQVTRQFCVPIECERRFTIVQAENEFHVKIHPLDGSKDTNLTARRPISVVGFLSDITEFWNAIGGAEAELAAKELFGE